MNVPEHVNEPVSVPGIQEVVNAYITAARNGDINGATRCASVLGPDDFMLFQGLVAHCIAASGAEKSPSASEPLDDEGAARFPKLFQQFVAAAKEDVPRARAMGMHLQLQSTRLFAESAAKAVAEAQAVAEKAKKSREGTGVRVSGVRTWSRYAAVAVLGIAAGALGQYGQEAIRTQARTAALGSKPPPPGSRDTNAAPEQESTLITRVQSIFRGAGSSGSRSTSQPRESRSEVQFENVTEEKLKERGIIVKPGGITLDGEERFSENARIYSAENIRVHDEGGATVVRYDNDYPGSSEHVEIRILPDKGVIDICQKNFKVLSGVSPRHARDPLKPLDRIWMREAEEIKKTVTFHDGLTFRDLEDRGVRFDGSSILFHHCNQPDSTATMYAANSPAGVMVRRDGDKIMLSLQTYEKDYVHRIFAAVFPDGRLELKDHRTYPPKMKKNQRKFPNPPPERLIDDFEDGRVGDARTGGIHEGFGDPWPEN